ncbi:MAG: HDOD domain-containing protein [Pseudomonadales bacterium]|nr:HDOD domain-containing protein [Pseudomonadales bacterium]MCP5214719.1 HDOD domain-containing protein [Pseudomonadales bacterium]
MSNSLDTLFAEVDADKLPSLPHVLLVLLDASHTEVIAFDRLSDLIKKDAALAARVVSAANAAYYGGQGKNLTFERTLVLLGLDTIKTIAITASVQQFFSRFDSASSRRLKHFWHDSLSCAIIAKSIAKLTGYAYGDEAYLAGLMHNIGELIFVNNFHEEYTSIIEDVESKEAQTLRERERFGGDRYQAGAWLIAGWGIDSFMADAIMYQSESVDQIIDAHHLVKIIYLSNQLCDFVDRPDDQALLTAERLFDLDQALVKDVVSKAHEEVREAAKAMDIEIDEEPLDAAINQDQLFSADEIKQVELADRVRNVALMDGIRQQLTRATSEAAVLQTIKQGLNILFSARTSFFFLLNQKQNALSGKASGEPDLKIEEFNIPIGSDTSLIARCFNNREVISSFRLDENEPASVVDRQVINLTSNDGILCLPLVIDKHELGVLVIGFDQIAQERLDRQQRLFRMFANEAANHMLIHQQSAEAEEQRKEENREYYHSRAREIVHEVNNPLSIINNYVHILSTKLDESHVVQDDISIIKEELERAGNILLRLPGIAEKQTTSAGDELVNVNTVISDLLRVFRSSLFVTHQIESVVEFDEEMEPIVVDRNALKQIVTNIIKNAAEAMPESGRISVSTQRLVNHNGKNYIEIVIADNGPGIPDAIKTKLFSPVETTKGQGHAGLGLTIVKNLLDDMGGAISCRSGTKSGTRFEILIPRAIDN